METPAPFPTFIDVGLGVVLTQPSRIGFCSGHLRVLMTRRPDTTVYGGWWEFPGGKAEPGETPEACVARELEEELGVLAEVIAPVPGAEELRHVYEHAAVRLHPRLCRLAPNSLMPQNLSVAEHRWATGEELASLRILPANGELVEQLAALLADPYGRLADFGSFA